MLYLVLDGVSLYIKNKNFINIFLFCNVFCKTLLYPKIINYFFSELYSKL